MLIASMNNRWSNSAYLWAICMSAVLLCQLDVDATSFLQRRHFQSYSRINIHRRGSVWDKLRGRGQPLFASSTQTTIKLTLCFQWQGPWKQNCRWTSWTGGCVSRRGLSKKLLPWPIMAMSQDGARNGASYYCRCRSHHRDLHKHEESSQRKSRQLGQNHGCSGILCGVAGGSTFVSFDHHYCRCACGSRRCGLKALVDYSGSMNNMLEERSLQETSNSRNRGL